MKKLLLLGLLTTTAPAWSAPMNHDAMHMPEHHDMGSMDMSGGMHDMHGMGKMQSGSAPTTAREPDYSQGRGYGPSAPLHMMGNGVMMSLLFNRFEVGRSEGDTTGNYELEGWIGDDWDRAVLKSEGDFEHGKLSSARTELLWRKPITTFWNTEIGLRQDSGVMPDSTWLALGINGLSPYWVELTATGYIADQGRTALRLNAEYDLRITQRLVLQPSMEASLYGSDDAKREVGSGLSDTRIGLRLRYDVLPVFAPYIGIEQTRHHGKTADYLSLSGESTSQTQVLAGVRFWF